MRDAIEFLCFSLVVGYFLMAFSLLLRFGWEGIQEIPISVSIGAAICVTALLWI